MRTTKPLPTFTEQWTGKIPRDAHDWRTAFPYFTREPATLALVGSSLVESPYGPQFSQGATIVPRMLFFVEERGTGPLGTAEGSTLVRSERSNTEKAPWKNLPAVTGAIENEFIHPVLLGESILPYRILPPRTAGGLFKSLIREPAARRHNSQAVSCPETLDSATAPALESVFSQY